MTPKIEYDFSQTPAAELAADIERLSRELPGFQGDQRGKQMAQLVLDQKPDIAVEIGVYGGRSLIPVALAMRLNKRGSILGIDPWDEQVHHEGLSDNKQDGDLAQDDLNAAHKKMWEKVEELQLGKYVNIIKAPSRCCFLRPLLAKKIDILHIDGAHSKQAAFFDAASFGSMVRPGGYIWMDDTDWPSVKWALELIEQYSDCVSDQGTYRLYHVR